MQQRTMTIDRENCLNPPLRPASKTKRVRPISVVHMSQKLSGVVLIVSLYIPLVQSLSFAHHQQQQHAQLSRFHRLERINKNNDYASSQMFYTSPATLMSMSTSTSIDGRPSSDSAVQRDNKIDDAFFESSSGGGGGGGAAEEDHERRNHDNHHQNPQHNSLKNYQHNTISLDNSLEESEMFSNNHQSSSSNESPSTITAPVVGSNGGANSNQQHSRHNSYQLGSNNNNHQAYHYGKYSPNMFANNYNLNYIHSFLSSKPPFSPTTSSGQHSSHQSYANPNGLTLSTYGVASSQHQQLAASPFAYISASSALSAAVNTLQQTIAQKQQQLANLNSRLNGLAGQSITDLEPQQQQQQPQPQQQAQLMMPHNQNNASVGDLPGSSMCGRQQVAYREPRVVGGNNTYEGEFPWAVSIQRHGSHHCGGVIVGHRWILTAAHCVRSQLVGNLAVRTGGHTLSRTLNGLNSHLEKDYPVEQIVMHDDFSRYDNLTASQMKSSANTNNADIALLKLKQEIHWNELAWPVCFPNKEAGNFSGHDATVIGWGKLNEKSEEFSNELQKVKLTIIDNKVCQNWFRQAGRDMPIDDRIICAGFKHGGKDACHGDSGGPLLSRINGQYVVVGVVSTGIGCARPLLPGLYSRVSSYIGWIERYITN